MKPKPLRIGVSSCLFHEDPTRPVFHGKPLYYLLRPMASWIASESAPEHRALVYLIPDPTETAGVTANDIASDLDGLVLQGGVDMSPTSYGEEPKRPEWSGDAARDAYEIALVRSMIDAEKPVLGICRGHQVVNVALGGTLHQDIVDGIEGARVHREAALYEAHAHEIVFEPGAWLDRLYPGVSRATVNSVHHQAVKDLGDGVRVVARSEQDGVIEAIAVDGPAWVRGVQWHPELTSPDEPQRLDNGPILRDFLSAARTARARQ